MDPSESLSKGLPFTSLKTRQGKFFWDTLYVGKIIGREQDVTSKAPFRYSKKESVLNDTLIHIKDFSNFQFLRDHLGIIGKLLSKHRINIEQHLGNY